VTGGERRCEPCAEENGGIATRHGASRTSCDVSRRSCKLAAIDDGSASSIESLLCVTNRYYVDSYSQDARFHILPGWESRSRASCIASWMSPGRRAAATPAPG
jgi:hypothetical protein